jgi:hypothetical protein
LGIVFTVSQLEQKVSRLIDDYHSFTTTTAGNAGGTYLVCTTLRERPGDGWVPYFVVPSAGSASGEIRPTAKYEPVDDDVSDLSVLYVQTPFSAQIATSIAFRVHRFHPTRKIEAIDEALRMPRFLRQIPNIVSEDMPSGNLLRNPHFEYWLTSARPLDWEIIAGTPARSTTAYEERYSVSLPASADLRQRIRLPYELDEETLIFTGRANGSGFTARVAITEDGATTNNDTVLGAGWNTLSHSFTITDPLRPFFIDLISSGGTIIWDNVRLMLPVTAAGQEYGNFIPASEMYRDGFSKVQVGYYEQASVSSDGGFGIKDKVIDYQDYGLPEYYERGYGFYPARVYGAPSSYRMGNNLFHYPTLGAGHFLRITGEGRYLVVSATTDEVELPSEEAADYLAALAAIRLHQKGIFGEFVGERERWAANREELEREATRMEADGIAIPKPIIAHSIFR